MDRLQNEILHSKKISSNAELIWGWDTPAGRRRAHRRGAFFVELGVVSKNSKVLEIGCGTGLFTSFVAVTGAQVTAIDLSEELLARARANNKNSNAVFTSGDVHKLCFSDNSFDVVFGSSVLHHLDVAKAFTEIFRVLKPGGRIVFAEPNMLNPQIMIQKNIPFIKKLMGDSPDETAFFSWGIKSAVGRFGFIDVRVKAYDFLHPWIPKSLVNIFEKLGMILESMPILRGFAGSLIISARKPNQ